jgi:multidrug resistance efflux pump
MATDSKKKKQYLATGLVVLVAVIAVLLKYSAYVANPWTRDGQVRARVVQIAPRVSGPIVELPIVDNQRVKAGDVLFQIDPRTYEASLAQARAELDVTLDTYEAENQQVAAAEAAVEAARHAVSQAAGSIREAEADLDRTRSEFERQKEMLPRGATSKRAYQEAEAALKTATQQRRTAVAGLRGAEANLSQAKANLAETQANLGKAGEENAKVRAARAALRKAELDLEFTTVRAPVDGYVTNVLLQLGSQMVANQPQLALVDMNSFWIDGYFRETLISEIEPGDQAVVTLMSYPDEPLEGRVTSVNWGISQSDGSTGFELLPTVSPTFEWIRLAQRIPVRIHITELPDGVELRVGNTCTVLVRSGTADEEPANSVPPIPELLQ